MDESTARNLTYVFAMAIGGLIRAMGMQALNLHRLQRGETIAYDDTAFFDLADEYGLHHDTIMKNLF